MHKCIGCGVELQNTNEVELGYTKDLSFNLCERCFRIRNYNEYKFVTKSNDDFVSILKEINKTNDLVILVQDLFNISKNLEIIKEYLNNDILLVLTKRDLLPKSCYDEKLIKYFDRYNLNIIDSIIISSTKNYNFDDLFNKINKYKKSSNVYVVGFTNAGKSTMINKILYNYSSSNTFITTSNLPSTTIDSISVKVNDDLTLIDTPGLLDLGDVENNVESESLKKVIPTKEIKPITYQIKNKQTILIEDFVKLELSDTNITMYLSNKLNIKRVYKSVEDLDDLKCFNLDVKKGEDIVIQGLGFINVSKACKVKVYTSLCQVYARGELI